MRAPSAAGKGGLVSWWRRCAGACCGPRGRLLASLRAFGAAMVAWLVGVTRAPRQFYQQVRHSCVLHGVRRVYGCAPWAKNSARQCVCVCLSFEEHQDAHICVCVLCLLDA